VTAGLPLPFADDRILLNLAAYWSARRVEDALPLRGTIDPLDMPRRLLPFLVLAEPAGTGRVMRFRLVGTELVQRFHRDATGKTTAEIYSGAYRDYMEQLYATVIETGQPLYAESTQRWPEEGMSRVRRLLLPVAADADAARVAFVLGAVTWSVSAGPGKQPEPQRIPIQALEKGVLQATFRGMLDAL
jgi:hypothetical protein